MSLSFSSLLSQRPSKLAFKRREPSNSQSNNQSNNQSLTQPSYFSPNQYVNPLPSHERLSTPISNNQPIQLSDTQSTYQPRPYPFRAASNRKSSQSVTHSNNQSPYRSPVTSRFFNSSSNSSNTPYSQQTANKLGSIPQSPHTNQTNQYSSSLSNTQPASHSISVKPTQSIDHDCLTPHKPVNQSTNQLSNRIDQFRDIASTNRVSSSIGQSDNRSNNPFSSQINSNRSLGQSHNETNQSIDRFDHSTQQAKRPSATLSEAHINRTSQSSSQSITQQSTNQSNNQTVNQSNNQLNNQTYSQSSTRSSNQPIKHPINQTNNQSNNQSVQERANNFYDVYDLSDDEPLMPSISLSVTEPSDQFMSQSRNELNGQSTQQSNNQTFKRSTNQSIDQPITQAVVPSQRLSFRASHLKQPNEQSNNQSTKQHNEPLVDRDSLHPAKRLKVDHNISQPFNQSITPSYTQPAKQSISQSIKQLEIKPLIGHTDKHASRQLDPSHMRPLSQSVSQPAHHSVKYTNYQPMNQPTNQLINQANQPTPNQPTNQPINQLIDQSFSQSRYAQLRTQLNWPHLDRLNDDQFLAVTLEQINQSNNQSNNQIYPPPPPLLLTAAPGSGKTLTLATRIAFKLINESIKPHRLLGITFTRKACQELKERVELICSSINQSNIQSNNQSNNHSRNPAHGITICNFHQLSLMLLMNNTKSIGFVKQRLSIISDTQSKDLIRGFVARWIEQHQSNTQSDQSNNPSNNQSIKQDIVFTDEDAAETMAFVDQLINQSNTQSSTQSSTQTPRSSQSVFKRSLNQSVKKFDTSSYRGDVNRLEQLTSFVFTQLKDQRRNQLKLKLNSDGSRYLYTAINQSNNQSSISDEDFPILQSIFQQYDQHLSEHCLLGLSDLCPALLALWTADAQSINQYNSRFDCIFVDEGQDTATQEIAMMLALIGHEQWDQTIKRSNKQSFTQSNTQSISQSVTQSLGRSSRSLKDWKPTKPLAAHLTVVGDPHQSIYAWRGADWRAFQRLEQALAPYQAQTINLSRNYRSSQTIVQAAIAVIESEGSASGTSTSASQPNTQSNNRSHTQPSKLEPSQLPSTMPPKKGQIDHSIPSSNNQPNSQSNNQSQKQPNDQPVKKPFMWSAIPAGPLIRELDAETPQNEAEMLVQLIKRLLDSKQFESQSIAVLARRNETIKLIRAEAVKAHIPVQTAKQNQVNKKSKPSRYDPLQMKAIDQSTNPSINSMEKSFVKSLKQDKKLPVWREALDWCQALGDYHRVLVGSITTQSNSQSDEEPAHSMKRLMQLTNKSKSTSTFKKLNESFESWKTDDRPNKFSINISMYALLGSSVLGRTIRQLSKDLQDVSHHAERSINRLKYDQRELICLIARRLHSLYQSVNEAVHQSINPSVDGSAVGVIIQEIIDDIQCPSTDQTINQPSSRSSVNLVESDEDDDFESIDRTSNLSFNRPVSLTNAFATPLSAKSANQSNEQSIKLRRFASKCPINQSVTLLDCHVNDDHDTVMGNQKICQCPRSISSFDQLIAFNVAVQSNNVRMLYPQFMHVDDDDDDATTNQSNHDDPIMETNNRNGVTLSTVHAAKGLEWPCVIIASFNEHLFFSRQNLRGKEDRSNNQSEADKLKHIEQTLRECDPDLSDDECRDQARILLDDMMAEGDCGDIGPREDDNLVAARGEDCRLAYVACTRAKSQLIVSWTHQDGNGRHAEKSRYLTAIPDSLIERPAKAKAYQPTIVDALKMDASLRSFYATQPVVSAASSSSSFGGFQRASTFTPSDTLSSNRPHVASSQMPSSRSSGRQGRLSFASIK